MERHGSRGLENEAAKGGRDHAGKGPAGHGECLGFLLEVMGNHQSVLKQRPDHDTTCFKRISRAAL